jgi:hypothetical protein
MTNNLSMGTAPVLTVLCRWRDWLDCWNWLIWFADRSTDW